MLSLLALTVIIRYIVIMLIAIFAFVKEFVILLLMSYIVNVVPWIMNAVMLSALTGVIM